MACADAGSGELFGYTLRYASGRRADSSRLYWPITLPGNLVHMAAAPALAGMATGGGVIVIDPLAVAALLVRQRGYQIAVALPAIPALLTPVQVAGARLSFVKLRVAFFEIATSGPGAIQTRPRGTSIRLPPTPQFLMSWRNKLVGISRPRPCALASS